MFLFSSPKSGLSPGPYYLRMVLYNIKTMFRGKRVFRIDFYLILK
jgi:hypothetical protein